MTLKYDRIKLKPKILQSMTQPALSTHSAVLCRSITGIVASNPPSVESEYADFFCIWVNPVCLQHNNVTVSFCRITITTNLV